jgi:hypothetical protein
MPTKKCPNGHQYDSSIYGDNCPFCPESSHTRVNNDDSTQSTRATGWDGGGETDATAPYQEDIGGGHTVIRNLNGTGMSNPDGGRKLVGVLISYSANPAGEVYKIYEGRNIVGRSNTADISFSNDDKMSKEHLLILYVEAEGIVWAEDQKSSNGTYINGKFARGMVELHTNDIIVLGATKMVFLGVPEF